MLYNQINKAISINTFVSKPIFIMSVTIIVFSSTMTNNVKKILQNDLKGAQRKKKKKRKCWMQIKDAQYRFPLPILIPTLVLWVSPDTKNRSDTSML